MEGYRTRDVCDLLGLTPALVRRYVSHGLVNPLRGERGEYRFGFRDMVVLRTAKGLKDAGIPTRRALVALHSLLDALGDARSLASLRLVADGGQVVVNVDGGLWNARSGQGHLELSLGELAGEVAELPGAGFARTEDDPDSDDWFNLGVDLEGLDPARALDAYRVALALDPDNVDAHVNIGRLLQCDGRRLEAQRHYRQALARVPDHQLALFNLGTLFDETDDLDSAMAFYTQAADVADAHYNLCRIFELRGDELAAQRHLRRYRELANENPS